MSDSYSDLYIDSYDNYTPTSFNKVKSVFALDIGGVNYVSDIISFGLRSKPLSQERITFGKYSKGLAAEWNLDVTAGFDGGSQGSLHDFLWNYAGFTTQFLIRPFQEFDPDNKRYYGGYLRIPYRPEMKVDAGNTSTFDYAFDVIGTPVRTDRPLGIVTGKVYDQI